MSAGGFRLKALRPLNINTRRLVTGAELLANAESARRLIEAGDARLVDDRDLQRLIAVVGARQAPPITR